MAVIIASISAVFAIYAHIWFAIWLAFFVSVPKSFIGTTIEGEKLVWMRATWMAVAIVIVAS